MKTSKNFHSYFQNSIKFITEHYIIISAILLIALLIIPRNCNAQIDFSKIPTSQKFTNNAAAISVKNIALTQYDKEYDCTWKTSHAQIDGLLDTKTQDFLNDWLSGMTYFGNCEGDKECFDFLLFHYYYKVTRISLVRNDLLGFYLHEGNCKTSSDSCMETQDWEVYDLRNKRFLQESDFFKQDEKSQKVFFALIENKVKKQRYSLVNDWKAYTRQFGLDGNNVVIYLSNDILNDKKGVVLRFSPSEIYMLLEPCIEKRLYFKNCETDFQKLSINNQIKK